MAKFAMAIALSMIVGCAAAADAPGSDPAETQAEAAPAENTSTASEQLTLTPVIQPAIACSGTLRVCLSGFDCHHEEGRDIGILGCTGGKICCQF